MPKENWKEIEIRGLIYKISDLGRIERKGKFLGSIRTKGDRR